MRRAPALLRVGLLVWGLCALGSAGAGDPTDLPDLTRRIIEEDHDLELRTFTLGRVRASYPQRVSVAAGALWTRQPVSYDCTTVCEMRGWVLEVEPGLSGAQISAGYAVAATETGRHRRFLSRVYRAYGVRAAILRTWDGAGLSPEDQTLLGLEGEFTVIGVSLSLGAFHRIGAGGSAEWVVGGGLGWGF